MIGQTVQNLVSHWLRMGVTYAESVYEYDIDQDQYKWLTSAKQIPVRDEFYEEYEDTWPPDHYYSPDPMCFM